MAYEIGKVGVDFEKTPMGQQEEWLLKAATVLDALDKLNMAVVNKATIPTHGDRQVKLNKLIPLIDEFVKGLPRDKRNLLIRADHFPAQELAMRIVNV